MSGRWSLSESASERSTSEPVACQFDEAMTWSIGAPSRAGISVDQVPTDAVAGLARGVVAAPERAAVDAERTHVVDGGVEVARHDHVGVARTGRRATAGRRASAACSSCAGRRRARRPRSDRRREVGIATALGTVEVLLVPSCDDSITE